MRSYNSLLSDGKYKFSSEYGKAVSVVLPQIIILALEYVLINWLTVSQASYVYIVFSFILGTVAGYLTLVATLQFMNNRFIDFGEGFRNISSFINYIIYAVIVAGIGYLLNTYVLVDGENLEFLLGIVKPFERFMSGANSPLGFAFRFVIVLDLVLVVYGLIVAVLLAKFTMIPFAIVDNENVIEAVRISWEDTTDYFGEIVSVFFSILLKVIIILDVFIFLAFISLSAGFIKFMTFIIYMLMIFWILPFAYTVFGTIYIKLRK